MKPIESNKKLYEKIQELETALKQAREKVQGNTIEIEAHEALLRLAMEDMRRIYDDFLKTSSQLTQADKLAAIGTLSAGVIHEINNPLFVIQGSHSILKNKIAEIQQIVRNGSPAETKTLFGEIENSLNRCVECAGRIAKIVKDIRVFSRSDKGQNTIEDVNNILDGIIGIAWNTIKNKAELQKSYGELPKIPCYSQPLGQVFLNLLVNASQAITGKGVISVKTHLSGGRVLVEISDTGSGISEEVRSRIFEPFFTTKDADTGTGLGLSISADIIKKHSGTIEVQSQVGRGTTFTISLPVSS